MTDRSELLAVIDRYATAVGDLDRAGFVALFTEDCEVVDPYPEVCADRVAAVYTTTGSPEPGLTVQLDGIDVFTIADGRIAALEAYWDPTTVRVIDGTTP